MPRNRTVFHLFSRQITEVSSTHQIFSYSTSAQSLCQAHPPRFELRLRGPKPLVLPLHHGSIVCQAFPSGFEPKLRLSESRVLPLHYGKIKWICCETGLNCTSERISPVDVAGFEPIITDNLSSSTHLVYRERSPIELIRPEGQMRNRTAFLASATARNRTELSRGNGFTDRLVHQYRISDIVVKF